MAEKLKSAFELAMERLRAKESESSADAALTPEQKERIAAVRAEFKSRRDEMEFLHRSAVAKAQTREDAADRLRQLEDEIAVDRARMDEEEETAVRAIRGT